ncbi:MAG: cytosine permease [Bacteroidia bacterium]|nr:cytosine permease [Bacteroidia bacterium]
MEKDSLNLPDEIKSSPLYSEELAPVPLAKRTWNRWNLAALWVGMAVCIPTYLLASYMIRSGLSWQASLIIIGLANLVITVPMVLNGHPGVKYGIPFPVIGRASFGTSGIHLASVLRALVACGWFGIQTWIGGLAFYSIWNALTGQEGTEALSAGKFLCFALFWIVNIYFIWKGTESIKWLEDYSAPILILIGIILIFWGYRSTGSFSGILSQGKQLQQSTVSLVHSEEGFRIALHPLKKADGSAKVSGYSVLLPTADGYFDTGWKPWDGDETYRDVESPKGLETENILEGKEPVKVQFRNTEGDLSTIIDAYPDKNRSGGSRFWDYILWFTAMIGFWATMSISISDITRFSKSQKDQVEGQFIGLPGTMIFYSFVGIFVTCAAIVSFKDILVSEDAPWDPVSLVGKFNNPGVVVFVQVSMTIATLSTNIAANVIAPANAFSNIFPKKVSFRAGGVIAGIIGIIICPWWLMDEISSVLILVSGLLGPVVGILIADYYLVRRTRLDVAELYKTGGGYAYGGSGINSVAMVALVTGILAALAGKWWNAVSFLYSLSWFTGFFVSFIIYYLGMKNRAVSQIK